MNDGSDVSVNDSYWDMLTKVMVFFLIWLPLAIWRHVQGPQKEVVHAVIAYRSLCRHELGARIKGVKYTEETNVIK